MKLLQFRFCDLILESFNLMFIKVLFILNPK
jgi:hypothetical protein